MAAGRCASIKEITECSICLDTFKHPKGLPCLHTFCLLCLERFCKDNVNNENTRACPLCRKAFVIPEGGIQDLPNNFMIDKFMLANPSIRNAVITDKTAFCELCLDIDVKAVAIAYCLECEQHICERHLLSHKSKKQSKSHKISLFDDDDEPYAREMLVRNDQLKDNIAKIEICTLTSRIKVDAFEREKTALIAQVNVAEKEINDKFNQVLSLIKSHRNLLLYNLGTFRNEKLTTLDQRIDEEETRFQTLERFNSDVLEIDNAENVCYATSNYLHARAVKLVETHCAVKSTVPIEVDVTFVPSYFTANGFKNLIGELRFQDNTFWSGGQCQEQLRSQLSYQTANFTPNPMTLQISPGHVSGTFSIRSPTSERPTRRNMTFNTPTTMSPITINSPMRPSRPNGLSSPTTTPNSAMRPFVEVSSRSANRRFNPVARHPPLGRTINGQFQSVFGQQPLTSRILDSVPLEEQKQILGERIYPLVSLTYPDIARKITGMLLEIDNEALLLLLQSHEALKSKVKEAVTVLQAYQEREIAASRDVVS